MFFAWAFSENTILLLPCMGKFAILMISNFLSVQEQNTTSVNMTEKSKIAAKYHLKIWSWLEFSGREEVDACLHSSSTQHCTVKAGEDNRATRE